MSDAFFRYGQADTFADSDREFYRCIFEEHPFPAWVYDPKTLQFLLVNASAVAEYQYTKEEFLRMRVTDLRAMDDVPELMRLLAGAQKPSTDSAPWRHQRKDKSKLDVTLHSRQINVRGRAACLVIVRNISEKQQLRQKRNLYETAMVEASEAMIITDTSRSLAGPRIVFANAAFSALTGYEPHEVVGSNASILRGPKSRNIPFRQIARDLRKSDSMLYENVNYRKDGSEFVAEWKLIPLRNEFGEPTHVLVQQRDVTERNRTRDRIVQAQKMEAVGRLAGGVAHDFNNLLTIILGYTGLLSLEMSALPAADQKRARSLEEIQKAAEKAAALTRQLLAFSRKEVVRARVFEINPVVAKVESMLRRLIGEDIDLDFALASEAGSILADPSQLEHVLMNLAANARDAMPNGGMLTIETRREEISELFAGHTSVKAGSYVVLVVTDTGHGMEESTRERAFEPFFTTKESGKGTGLGLSMVYGFAQQCGGTVGLYSEPGRGACFRVYLPRAESAQQTEAGSAAPRFSRGSGTILVVEDELGIRELVKQVLSSAGYRVFTAANAVEAMRFSGSHDYAIDLLVSDVVLPGISGPELAERLRACNPNLKVLFASGYSDHALLRQGTLETGAAFLHKPFDRQTLLEKVGESLAIGKRSSSNAS